MDDRKMAETIKYDDEYFEAEVEKVRRKFGIDKLTKQQRRDISNDILQASIDHLYRRMNYEKND